MLAKDPKPQVPNRLKPQVPNPREVPSDAVSPAGHTSDNHGMLLEMEMRLRRLQDKVVGMADHMLGPIPREDDGVQAAGSDGLAHEMRQTISRCHYTIDMIEDGVKRLESAL